MAGEPSSTPTDSPDTVFVKPPTATIIPISPSLLPIDSPTKVIPISPPLPPIDSPTTVIPIPPPLPPTDSPTTVIAKSPPPEGSQSDGGDLPLGMIAGVVIGVGIVLAVVGIFAFLYKKRKRKLAAGSQNLPFHEPKNLAGQPLNVKQDGSSPSDNQVTLKTSQRLGPVPVSDFNKPPSTSSNLDSNKPFPPASPGIPLGNFKSTFTYEELKVATDNFSESNLLGQGGFGYVHKGVLANGKVVAIKQLKVGSAQGEREFRAEIEIISHVHHRHLVSLFGYCIFGKERLVMNWQTRMKIALGSARGLTYLHEDCQPMIIHRDIKSANILLDDTFEAKVADFGLAKHSLDTDTHVSTRVMGTFGYLAPEYASSGKLTDKADVFSFGVLLLELITGFRPHELIADDSMVDWAKPLLVRGLEDSNFDDLVDKKLEEYDSAEMVRMAACIVACIRYSARRRPKMSQIVRALEGSIPLDDLTGGITQGQNTIYGSYRGSDYRENMKKFIKIALESDELGSSNSSDSGQNPTCSSTEEWQTAEGSEAQRKLPILSTKDLDDV